MVERIILNFLNKLLNFSNFIMKKRIILFLEFSIVRFPKVDLR